METSRSDYLKLGCTQALNIHGLSHEIAQRSVFPYSENPKIVSQEESQHGFLEKYKVPTIST